jgi:hypothetical protein
MEKTGWQFLFLVHADFRDDYHGLNSIILSEFKVFILELFDFLPDLSRHSLEMLYMPLWPNDYSEDIIGLPKTQKMHFLELKKDNSDAPYWNKMDETDLPDENEQVEVWSNFLKKNFNRKNDKALCVVLWGHSYGYGFFPELGSLSRNKLNFINSFLKIDDNKIDTLNILKAKLFETENKTTVLTFEELGKVFQNVFHAPNKPAKKIVDLLVAHACEMANIYFLNPISPYCKLFIAAQSDIGIPGFNFPAIFKVCNNPNHLSHDELAKLFVHSFYEQNGLRFLYSLEIEKTAIFAINPDFYNEIIAPFKHFISELTMFIKKNFKANKENLIKARQKNINFSFSSLFFRIDILAWLNELINIFPNETFISAFRNTYIKALNKYISYSFKGRKVQNFNHKSDTIDNHSILPNGLSIHYPLDINTISIDEIFSGSNQSSFIFNNGWWKTFYKDDFPVPNW